MDIRSVQKSGNMHYIYLPKVWCIENKITPRSKVSISYDKEGILSIFPSLREEKPKKLDIAINDIDEDRLQKLIVASYLNAFDFFRISLAKDMDLSKVMEQKRVISLESVEFDKNIITCDSIVSIRDPGSLLKTMIRKIKNMIGIMLENPNCELLQRYEEEIDKSALLIEKAVINHYSFVWASKLKSIDLHYTSWTSKALEQVVDELMSLDKKETSIRKSLLAIINDLHHILENINNLDYKIALEFIKKSNDSLKYVKVKDPITHSKQRIKQLMNSISDTVIDWAITKEIERS